MKSRTNTWKDKEKVSDEMKYKYECCLLLTFQALLWYRSYPRIVYTLRLRPFRFFCTRFFFLIVLLIHCQTILLLLLLLLIVFLFSVPFLSLLADAIKMNEFKQKRLTHTYTSTWIFYSISFLRFYEYWISIFPVFFFSILFFVTLFFFGAAVNSHAIFTLTSST